MRIEEINKFWKEYDSARAKLRKAVPEYLQEALRSFEGGKLNLSDPENDEEDDDYVYVSYDGGRHPEYASNPYSIVRGVCVKEGRVFLNLDEDNEYSLDRVCDAAELCDLADAVQSRLDELNGKKEEAK